MAVTIREVLGDRQFLRYLCARSLSSIGNIATLIALPVLVYRASGNAGLTALVAALEAAPYLLFGLFAGALTDRWNRKTVMVIADVAALTLLLTVPVAHLITGEVVIAHVLLVAFCAPAIAVFFDGAVFGAVPMLVGRDRIPVANSLAWSITSVVEIVVPSLVGFTLGFVHPAWLLGFDAITFGLSAILLLGITRPMYDATRERPPLRARQILRDIGEGLRFIAHHAGVRTMTIIGFTQCVVGGGYMSLTVVWLDRLLGLGTSGWQFGVTYGTWAIGGLIASISLPVVLRAATPARITLVCLPLSAGLGVLAPWITIWWLAAALFLCWAVPFTMVAINSITYRQQVTPEHLLGRVNTAGRMLSWGLGWTGGSLLAGAVVGPLGLRPTLVGFTCFAFVGVAIAWSSNLSKEQRAPELARSGH